MDARRSFSGSAQVERVAAQFERGATIVLQALQLQHPPLAEFCRELERELGHPVQANAYYTPRRARRASRCTTTRTTSSASRSRARSAGSCTRPSLELPLKNQKYSPELGEPGEPVMDVTMRAGDTLYLPRGWLHQAMTSDTASLHLTVGINVTTWLDAVRAAVDEAAEEDVLFRRGVGADGAAPEGLARGSGRAAHARSGRTPSAPLVRREPPADSR